MEKSSRRPNVITKRQPRCAFSSSAQTREWRWKVDRRLEMWERPFNPIREILKLQPNRWHRNDYRDFDAGSMFPNEAGCSS
jgi:hypothetical protein